jgi:two-component system sensor histidine kinase UhpB
MLAVQLVLIRRVMAPLGRLAEEMKRIDLRQPQELLEIPHQSTELATFVDAFNEMLRRLSYERRRSARAALGAQEAERLRTARELHDEVGQSLTAMVLQVERLAATVEGEAGERLHATAAQLRTALDDIRRIVRRLRPEALDLGLGNALIALTARVGRAADIRIDRDLDKALPPLSAEQELVIYRVAQEALTNVVRHASAAQAHVDLAAENGKVVLRVEDDGRGIPGRAAAEGSGIEGMRERALLVGANLTIHSRPGRGTEVKLTVPIDPASSDARSAEDPDPPR